MANEKRLIDADALIDTIDNINWYSVKDGKLILGAVLFTGLYMATDINHAIETAPTVDAVEVVHGYTIIADKPEKVLLDRKCGICDQLMLATDNYCPMCGARNEGEKIGGLLFADMEEIIDA